MSENGKYNNHGKNGHANGAANGALTFGHVRQLLAALHKPLVLDTTSKPIGGEFYMITPQELQTLGITEPMLKALPKHVYRGEKIINNYEHLDKRDRDKRHVHVFSKPQLQRLVDAKSPLRSKHLPDKGPAR